MVEKFDYRGSGDLSSDASRTSGQNKSANRSKTGDSSKLSVEPAVATVLSRSCNDCHSNRTVWPWYSHVAPASWLLVSDVNRGRKALNLSEWIMYQLEAQRKQLTEICKEVSEGEMPGSAYTLLHRHAKLSPSDVTAVCAWTRNKTQNLSDTTVQE